MADAGAAGRSGETPVGKQRDFLIQAHAGQYGSGIQHFTEAGAAFRAFVTDNDNVAGIDFLGADSFNCFFFRVKYPGRAGVYQHFFRHGAGFNDGAVGGQVAFQDSDAAGSAVGLFAAVDYIRTADFRVFDQRTDGLPGNGLAGFDDEPLLCQFMHNRADAAGFVQVRHMMGAAGAQESQVRGLLGNFIEQFQGQFDAGFVGNGGEVQRRVGAAADSHVNGNGVFERIHGYDISREHLFFDHADNGFAAFLGQTGAVSLISGGNRSVAGHSQTQYF